MTTLHPRLSFVLAALCSIGAASCGGALLSRSPHDRYLEMLRQAGVDQTALGLDWVKASAAALQQPVVAATPFRETAYFPPAESMAVGYRIELRRGRRLSVDVAYESSQPGRLFVDLFEVSGSATPRRVASLAPDASSLAYEVGRDGAYVLRIQPELLRGGRFTVTERTLASLPFPVSGLDARAVGSAFGDARDAGVREHEGVDIFAPKGTPVLAVTAGVARASTNNLGGNVVWLSDVAGGETYYYAHLDNWAARGMTTVRAGDVIGYVGNTGNARTTAPHLHFGIYDQGAVDPLPFLQPDEAMAPVARTRADYLGQLVRVTAPRADLRDSPAGRAAPLERDTVARVVGVRHTSVRVVLPDNAIGYLAADAVTAVDPPLRRERLLAASTLRELPMANAPIVEVLGEVMGEPLDPTVRVDVLGAFAAFELLRAPSGRTGWAEKRVRSGRRPAMPDRG